MYNIKELNKQEILDELENIKREKIHLKNKRNIFEPYALLFSSKEAYNIVKEGNDIIMDRLNKVESQLLEELKNR